MVNDAVIVLHDQRGGSGIAIRPPDLRRRQRVAVQVPGMEMAAIDERIRAGSQAEPERAADGHAAVG